MCEWNLERVGSLPDLGDVETGLDIEIRFFDDCPNWKTTLSLLEQIVDDLGLDAVLTTMRVATPEDAEKLRFRGSPTVLIDGEDPFDDGNAPVGLACRIYQTEEGLKGAPSAAQLREALSKR